MEFEVELKSAFERHLAALGTETPRHLREAMAYSLLAPGKRIRPRLLLACAGMLGLETKAALPAALALEMIHCFSLIHDDLPCMDDDDLRRGLPSNHKRFGEALALLAGDALMAMALSVWTEAFPHAASPGAFLRGQQRLLWALGPQGLIGGQAAESDLGAGSLISELEEMHARKTGALFQAALLIPRELAGLESAEPRSLALELFAREIGQAFQSADDLEDAHESGSSEPTSILFYLKPDEVRVRTRRRLAEAEEGLRTHWGLGAEPVLKISAEVSRALSATGGRS